MLRILSAISEWIEECQPPWKTSARWLRAFVLLLLRYSGLRIGDAVSCSVDRVAYGKIRLYMQKTGAHLHCPLLEFVVKELEAIPKMSERYWLWTGNGKLQTATGDWQGRLLDLFKNMKVKQFARVSKITVDEARKQPEAKGEGHAHRFRYTFAVELLLAGVRLERVSILLGHTSVRITEKHYASWVARTAGAGRGRRKAHMGARSDCAPRIEGDARGTRKARSPELTENKREKMAERVGF